MLSIIQIIISVILIALVLIQERSGGAGGIFGGSESEFYHKRRGLEKFVFAGTIVVAVIFALISVIRLII